MLDIELEYRKGILFVRLYGVLDFTTYKKFNRKVLSFIKKNGIKYVVYNIDGLYYIDAKGLDIIRESNNVVNGNLTICGINNNLVRDRIEGSSILKYINRTNNEINAMKEIII